MRTSCTILTYVNQSSLMSRVERPPSSYKGGGRFIPRPPPGSPPPQPIRRPPPPSSRQVMDRGGAGDHYAQAVRPQIGVTQQSLLGQPSSGMHQQFHPGFGPATSNLMAYTRGSVRGGALSDDETSPEISISEGDMDLTRMEELMDMYTGNPVMDPRAMMTMPMPTQELRNLAVVDEEVA